MSTASSRAVQTASDPPLSGDFDTLGQALEAAGHQFCDHEAYVEGPDRMTFGEWLARSRGVAAYLAAAGVRPGDVVVFMIPPSIDYAVCFGAVAMLGAVTTGINTRLGPLEVDGILRCARPALVLRDEHQNLPPVPDGLCPVMSREEISKAASQASPQELVPMAVSRRDPAVIIWTSGTTGTPKGAWFDHVGLQAAVTTAGVMSQPFDRRLVATPFAHAGYMAKLWEQLAWGTCFVIGPQPWNASDMVRLMREERVTVVGGVPTQWAKIVGSPELGTVEISSLRLCLSATAPAPAELVERVVKKLGCPLVVRYAMTESPSITGTHPEDPPEVQYRTVGKPQSGVEIELRDDHGTPVAQGQVGRIHIRSVCAMRGYWNAPEDTAAAFDGAGWLRSGDLGHLDHFGNLILDGRSDDMYIRGGYNVYPLEVEHILDEHPGVASSSVVGIEAPVIGQIGCAFVVPADPSVPPEPGELVRWCRSKLADYKPPDRIRLLPSLPLTSMMKVDKAALRELLESESSGPDGSRPKE